MGGSMTTGAGSMITAGGGCSTITVVGVESTMISVSA
jgi:hypothetical protein